ncbi:retrotransposon protein, putative, ty1-copia subclass [Tanacetum coccineum]
MLLITIPPNDGSGLSNVDVTDPRFQDPYFTKPHFADLQFVDSYYVDSTDPNTTGPSASPSVVDHSFTRLLQSVEQKINEVDKMTEAEKIAKESRQNDAERVIEQANEMGMSTENGVNPPAPNPAHNSNFSLLSVLGRERLTGPNYMDWMRNLRFTLRYENKEYVLDEQIPTIDDDSTQEEIEAHQKHYDDANKVSCIMASSMSLELQKTFENTWAYEMNQQLKEMFSAKSSKERLDAVKSLMACKPKPEASICAFILEMKGYFDRLESLNMVFDAELSINIILSSLPDDYNYLLQTAEQGIKKIDVTSTSAAPVLTVGHNTKKIKTSHSNWKGKVTKEKSSHGSKRKVVSEIAPTSDPKEAVCFYCNTKGHWKHSCPKYLKGLKDEKVEKGSHLAAEGGAAAKRWCSDDGVVVVWDILGGGGSDCYEGGGVVVMLEAVRVVAGGVIWCGAAVEMVFVVMAAVVRGVGWRLWWRGDDDVVEVTMVDWWWCVDGDEDDGDNGLLAGV